MKVTLTNEEIREVLAEALGHKLKYTTEEFKADDCWFTVDGDVETDDNEMTVEFTGRC